MKESVRLPLWVLGLAGVGTLWSYVLLLLADLVQKVWKVGFGATPLTFIGLSGIVLFSLYAIALISALGLSARRTSDPKMRGLTIAAVAAVALYVAGFASGGFSVL